MPYQNWILYRSACYLTGKGVTFGAPLIQAAGINQGVYSLCFAVAKGQGVAAFDQQLAVIADGSLDHAFVGPMVEAVDEPASLIREAATKLRLGGHLVVCAPLGHTEPGVTTFYAPADVDRLVSQCAHWQAKALYIKDGLYLGIFKKSEGRRGIEPAKPRPVKRACIARYGALGDAIVMTPLIKTLAEDGYEVTLNISSYCAPVFEGNPYVSNVLIQERDLVPNHLLGEYWNTWEKDYDKYINLSESIEGDLLQIENRPQFYTPKAWRHTQCNRNYYDYTLERGGYPEVTGLRGELYFTNAEERRAQKFFTPLRSHFTILWALNGSSHHKVYPLMEALLLEWFKSHPDSRCITVGDYTAKLLEFPHPQLIPKAGEWSIRESLIATKYANLVIGPETMITNAVGCFNTPKIVLLSHSTQENLTKYFHNDYSLEPSQETAPCYPCHQLHYTKESCPLGEMKDTSSGEILGQAPICSMAISPQRLLDQMELVYRKRNNL